MKRPLKKDRFFKPTGNVILLVNLTWAGWLQVRFVSRATPFTTLERWQTSCLPVYLGWAAVVVFLFRPLFQYAQRRRGAAFPLDMMLSSCRYLTASDLSTRSRPDSSKGSLTRFAFGSSNCSPRRAR